MSLSVTVNSFDLFDTLIARHCVTPQKIFEQVEARLRAPGFAALRVATEHSLLDAGQDYDLRAIYSAMTAADRCSAADAERLMAAEIEAEMDNVIPIVENLRQVRPFDLVISDMYLPREVLRQMLIRAGLRLPVHLLVTNRGKRNGSLWPQLAGRWLIQRHLGDDAEADVARPRAAGVPAEHYSRAGLSQVERLLIAHGLPETAAVARCVRLANPFPTDSPEGLLWQLQCQLNLPLLLLSATALKAIAEQTGRRKLLFSARDCYQLAEIFSQLHPGRDIEYIHVSRAALAPPRDVLLPYLDRAGLAEALVCDLASTGYSWHSLAEEERQSVHFFSVVWINTYSPPKITPEALAASRFLRFSCLTRSSDLSQYSSAIEVLNLAPHPSVLAIQSLAGGFQPVFAERHEFEPWVIETLLAAHQQAMTVLRTQRSRLLDELPAHPPKALVDTLVQSMSSDPLLRRLSVANRP